MDFSYLKEFMDKLTDWRVPGHAISVYHRNEEVFRYSSGYSDVESKIKMTGNELMNIYSCSKPITAVAALQLYEKGLFLLDDPLYDFIPEYREMYIKDGDGKLSKAENAITLRHLFAMTAGLTYNLESVGIDKAREITGGKMDTVTLAKCMAEDPLSFEPGTRWQYSLCHDVLAAVVEVISGQRFSDYVKENIFKPLGVSDIYYHRTEEVKAKMASQYEFASNDVFKPDVKGKWQKISKESQYVLGEEHDCGGAGAVISAPDYARFANAITNYGKAPNGEVILSKGAIDLLRENQLSRLLLDRDFDGGINKRISGYGYGLGVRTLLDKAKGGSPSGLGEFGWDSASGDLSLMDPEKGVAFFYARHIIATYEGMEYILPRIRNIVYKCIES